MKILFSIGSMNKGGAERVVANLSNYMSKSNDVGIVMSVNDTPKYELNKKINLYTLDNNVENRQNKIEKNIRRLKRLNEIIKEYNPDIIVSFLPEPSYRVLLLKVFNSKIPIIVSVRNDPKVEYKNIFSKILMKILYPLADGFVFQTEEAKQYFGEKIQKKSIIIPNPIKEELKNFNVYSGKRDNLIVSVGRLEKQKNQKMLIDAFAKLSREFDSYNLVIYGEGSLRQQLEKQVENLNLANRVFLPGETDNIIEKIHKAKIFVLSSDYEGMPNSLMEAMAMGIACISTDCPCGGPRFLIKDGYNGYLVPTNNVEALTNAMKKILKNDKNEVGERGYKTIIEKLDPKKIITRWQKYIRETARKEKEN